MSDQPSFNPEAQKEDVVHENLYLMHEQMIKVVMGESFGGNAGYYEEDGRKYSAAGANFYFDSQSGKIEAFGNIQDLPDEISRSGRYSEGAYRVAWMRDKYLVDEYGRIPLKVVGLHYWSKEKPNEEADKVLRETMRRWNEEVLNRSL